MPRANAVVDLVANDGRFNAAMRRVQSRMEKVRAAMQQVAVAARRVFLVGAAAATAAVVAFGSFEQKMARVKALTDSTGSSFERLNKLARDLGKSTVFSANQAAEAMGFLAQAGFEVNEIMTTLPDVLNLAAAGQLDMATAAEIAAKIIRGMNVDIEDFSKTTDILAKAFTTATTDLNELGEAMKFVGPIASKAGLSMEETVAALQLLADNAFSASLGGTALRNALLKLQTTRVTKFLQGFGLSIQDLATGGLKNLPDIIDVMNEAMSRVGTRSEQTAKLIELFGTRAGPGLDILLGEGGDALRRMIGVLENAGGTAKKVADTQLNTLFGEFRLLTSAAVEMAIAVGDKLAPAVSNIAGAIKSLIDGFNNLNPATQSSIVKMTLWGVGLAGAIALLPPIALGIKTLAGGLLLVNTRLLAGVALWKSWSLFAKVGVAAAVVSITLLIAKWQRFVSLQAEFKRSLQEPLTALNELSAVNAKLADDEKRTTEEQIGLYEQKAQAIDDAVAALKRERDAIKIVGDDPTFTRDQLLQRSDQLDRQIAKIQESKKAVQDITTELRLQLIIEEELADAAEKRKREEAAIVIEKQKQSVIDKKGLDIFEELVDKLAVLRGSITEGQLALIDLENLGVAADVIEKVRKVQLALIAEQKKQDVAGELQDEAKALKAAARTDEERLADELKRVEALKQAALLTSQEAAKVEAAIRKRFEKDDRFTARIEGIDSVINRIQGAAASRGRTGGPAARTATATTLTATQTKQTAKATTTSASVLQSILDLIELIRGELPLVGAFG